MITISPLKTEEMPKYIAGLRIFEKQNSAVLLAKEEQKELGNIVIKPDDIYLDILQLNIQNNSKFNTEEMLIKSAASYAMNRNLFTLRSKNFSLFSNLIKYKGKIIGEYLYIDIMKLISCNK